MLKKILQEQGFSEEQIKNVEKAMKDNKVYVTGIEDAEAVCRNLQAKYNDAKGMLDTTAKAISDMKKENKDSESLQKRIKEMEDEIAKERAASVSKIRNMTVDSAIEKALKGVEENHAELLAKAFDREKITVNDEGAVFGIDEQFKNIKEKYPTLFEEKSVELQSAKPAGANTANSGSLSLEQQINQAMGIK